MVPEWIDDPSHSPTIWLVFHRINGFGSRRDGLLKGRIRIFARHDHPDRTAPERLRAEILMLWRLIREPENGLARG
jgi:hypothetical protein